VGVGSDLVMMFEMELDERFDLELFYWSGTTFAADLNLFTVRIRYHNPGETDSNLIEFPVWGSEIRSYITVPQSDMRGGGAAFGHILRDSPHNKNADIRFVLTTARDAVGTDVNGHRRAFIEMVERFNADF
jgi:hypothetical protein